jgi:D-beta-D-heptose 7-phosphate kinase/D-beta-D-heptose 1-phosphate adenosyltransferase
MTFLADDLRRVKGLVLGDLMLDRYLEGRVHRISPEAPVPVVALQREWTNPGGAGNVAASLAALGCGVTVAGAVGRDAEGRQLAQCLTAAGDVRLSLIEHDAPTICKTRILAGSHQQMMRIDQDSRRDEYVQAAEDLRRRVVPLIREHQVVVLADYEKGTLSPELVRDVIEECRRRNIPCLVDPKKLDFSVYARATLLTPNLLETERAVGRPLPTVEQITAAARDLRRQFELDYMLVTRGPDGMTLAGPEAVTHFPAEVREVADVTGAGDTVVTALAAWLARGRDIHEACRVASIAAGIAVSRPGCYVVKAGELERALLGHSPKIADVDAAEAYLTAERRAGRRIVFTNGCFDILHAGHLACLESARELGDLLVVGLNSDASVRRLKGPGRPVNSEGHRANLLAGLACVDMVVVFDQDTPEALLQRLRPDILVKGANYSAEEVVGADIVRAYGGQVTTIPLIEGLSTTAIIKGLSASAKTTQAA